MNEKRVMKLASRGKRFGAACIDAAVPFVSYIVLTTILAANGIRYNYPGYGYGNGFGYGYGFDYGYGIGSQRLSGASAAVLSVVFIVLLAYIVAELVLFAKGKSIGKAALGLQVVSSANGKPFKFWKMFFRECFVKSASGSVFALGYIWILIDEKNRGWHDKILDSYVVDLKESERMHYKRQIEALHTSASAPSPVPAPAPAPAPAPEPAEEPSPEPEITELKPEVIKPESVVTEEQAGEDIVEDSAIEITPEVVEEITEEKLASEEISADEVSADTAAMSPLPDMSMKKEALLAAARERGIQVSSRATKAEILEAIEKANEDNGL